MKTVRSIGELRGDLGSSRREGKSIGFVPTMGAFHAGHLSLMRRAREECDVVVVSLFVNPTQFNDPADLERYPRDERRDSALASNERVDLLFAPSVEEMYPEGATTTVDVGAITEPLEGVSRGARHFRGVATVVTKLFNIVEPTIAYFGQKDAQQALVIKRMVRDLAIPVHVEVCPTVRESDGVAMSSRNALLSTKDRQRALALFRGIEAAHAAVSRGERDTTRILGMARAAMSTFDVKVEYIDIVSPDSLAPIARIDGEALLAVAARVGNVRLIDNAMLRPNSR